MIAFAIVQLTGPTARFTVFHGDIGHFLNGWRIGIHRDYGYIELVGGFLFCHSVLNTKRDQHRDTHG
ncbi:MAG: hypothetical protein ABIP64_18325, partial [Burkholderiales bacterium]